MNLNLFNCNRKFYSIFSAFHVENSQHINSVRILEIIIILFSSHGTRCNLQKYQDSFPVHWNELFILKNSVHHTFFSKLRH